jgi:NAD(P)-dependent dehydrogenase (short-subunit alcohol dehydrogenase family)
VDEIVAAGGRAVGAIADVRDFTAVRSAVQTLEGTLGPVDVAIANAGVYRLSDGANYDAERAEQVFATNVIGASHTLAAVLPAMVARKRGRVCAVSSMGALLALPGGGAYCASKAAIAMLMKSIRLDVERHGVRATTVFPGYVDTPMITDHERRTLKGLLTAQQAAEKILRAIERGRREAYFPFGLWLECRLAGWLPWPLYRAVMKNVPMMEET